MLCSEKEMMNLILSTANNDERIRAVIMNRSRTNHFNFECPYDDDKNVTKYLKNVKYLPRDA